MESRFKAVTLEITKRCNHRCNFCYSYDKNEKHSNITDEMIDFVVAKLKKYGIERVTISGGEPFMVRNQTKYLINRLLESKFDVCLNTNLSLVSEDDALFLEQTLGHDNVVYSSIPSVIEEHCDRITRVKGSYRNILNGIKHCKRHNIKIGLNMSVSQENIADIDFIPSFLEDNPVDSFTLFPVIPPIYDRNNKAFINDANNLIRVADMLLYIRERFGIVVGSIRPLPKCIIGTNEKYNAIIGSHCTTGNERFAINLETGEIEACSQEKHKYGNIFKDDIQDCYNRMKKWHDGEFFAGVCRTCELLEQCGGACLWSEPCGRC